MSFPHSGISRRTLIGAAGVGLAGAVLDTARPLSARADSSSLRTVYVAGHGDDSADGTTPATPWQTVDRVNRAYATKEFDSDIRILFRRGETYFGRLVVRSRTTTPFRTEIASYSEDPAVTTPPSLSAYRYLLDARQWLEVAPAVWRLDLAGKVAGFVDPTVCDTGLLNVSGVMHGDKRMLVEDLAHDWEFANEGTFLYVYSAVNPGMRGSIRAAIRCSLVDVQSPLDVQDMTFEGSGGHGVQIRGGVENVTISNCTVRNIGGAALRPGDPTSPRFGNGIEVWIGSRDVTVSNTRISSVYDTATTMQGAQSATARGWMNVFFLRNTITDCNQALEVWGTGDDAGPGAGFINCQFVYNVCLRSGNVWSNTARPDKGKGVDVLYYEVTVPCDIRVTYNTFTSPVDAHCSFATPVVPGFRMNHNTITLRAKQKIQAQSTLTVEQARAWTASTGLEVGSSYAIA